MTWRAISARPYLGAPRDHPVHHGRAVQVDPIKPTLKAPGTKLLKLKCDKPLSNFAFKINLRRYTMGPVSMHGPFDEWVNKYAQMGRA